MMYSVSQSVCHRQSKSIELDIELRIFYFIKYDTKSNVNKPTQEKFSQVPRCEKHCVKGPVLSHFQLPTLK
jgi:hypothetical protein